jgi:hypothetical protein
VAVLATVVCNPRGEELLQTRQGAGCEHLGAQRVLLQLLEIGLAKGDMSVEFVSRVQLRNSPRDIR